MYVSLDRWEGFWCMAQYQIHDMGPPAPPDSPWIRTPNRPLPTSELINALSSLEYVKSTTRFPVGLMQAISAQEWWIT